MPDRYDPFDGLRRPIVPLAPRPAFAAALRRRLQEELRMTTGDTSLEEAGRAGTGQLVMVHLRVGDADRAMAFFGALLGWEGERVEFGDHISYYTINTATTVRVLDDPSAPPVVPNYGVADVAGTIEAVAAAGGRVTEADPAPGGGGWARGTDDQGLPLLFFQPEGRSRASISPTRAPTGDVGFVFLRADAARAEHFYGRVLGWQLTRTNPAGQYFDAVPKVGVFDEAAASGRPVAPAATLYLSVDALAPALARVEELGGHAGPGAQDMGPYFSARCTDDQGTEFGLIAPTLDADANG
jgi:predicted enzyme related to lactoylglutathione lyase